MDDTTKEDIAELRDDVGKLDALRTEVQMLRAELREFKRQSGDASTLLFNCTCTLCTKRGAP